VGERDDADRSEDRHAGLKEVRSLARDWRGSEKQDRKDAHVTREHKLALIVGFSLILLVGVLISDHLSRARQARIAPVNQNETLVAEGGSHTGDLLKNDGTTAMPGLGGPTTIVSGPAQLPPQGQSNPGTLTQLPIATPQQSQDVPIGNTTGMTLTDANRRSASGTGQGPDPLMQAIADNHGSVVTLPNGQRVFSLGTGIPAAAGTATGSMSPASNARIAAETKTAAIPDNVKLYTIQKGDTLMKIAEKNYGSGKLWHELAKYNGIADSGVRIGAKLKLPTRETLTGKPQPALSESALASKSPAPTNKITPSKPAAKAEPATYTVKPGDTLGLIAQKALGTSKRWQEIVDLNKLDDEDTISTGTVLKLPPLRG
jgi:LysM repeat protein